VPGAELNLAACGAFHAVDDAEAVAGFTRQGQQDQECGAGYLGAHIFEFKIS